MADLLAGVLKVPYIDLDAHFFDDLGADSMLLAQFCARARKQSGLPSISMKDVYSNPTLRSLGGALDTPGHTLGRFSPSTPLSPLAEVLAGVLKVAAVDPDADFFDDLGADSMVLAQFCARVRKRADLPSVSMKEVYQHPSLRKLAAALAANIAVERPSSAPRAPIVQPDAGERTEQVFEHAAPVTATVPPRRASRLQFRACAAAQLAVVLFPLFSFGLIGVLGYRWIEPATGFVENYVRLVGFLAALTLTTFLLPIVAKWLLIGRFRPAEFAVWTPRYFRFWLVKFLIMRNPLLPLMVGSPLLPLYLRLLGARIGPGTTILSRQFPVCTDLFTVGAGTVIRKDVIMTGYRVEAGVVRTGRIAIGSRAIVSEQTVLDIDTAIGDDAQLGHASSLHIGQTIPAGERWHGSPGQPGAPDFTTVGPVRCTAGHRARFVAFQLLAHFLVTLPVTIGIGIGTVVVTENLVGVRNWGESELLSAEFLLGALWASSVLFFGGVLLGLPVLIAVSHLLNSALRPERTYRLFGFHHFVLRALTAVTNRKFYAYLFGDSSAIVPFLKRLGYRMSPYVQTGTNFGTGIKHDSPFAVHIGIGTVVADGLSTLSAEQSASSFRISPVKIGRNNYLGNAVAYPAGGRTGENCLLATKVMVPIDGELRTNVGLLGSPAFEIPRIVARDAAFAVQDVTTFRRALRAKNRHNTVTVGLQLLARWVYAFVMVVWTEAAAGAHRWADAAEPFRGAKFAVLGTTSVALFAFTIGYWLAISRRVNRLVTLAPDGVSVYTEAFWRHERYWKVPSQTVLKIFPGTPFQAGIWRAAGVRVGSNLFDDGCSMVERPFIAIGDNVTLNAGCTVQPHSQEDGGFKSGHIRIGNEVTVGPGAWVHYGVVLGDGATIEADSFLMKGEEVPPHARWGGNPARELVPGGASDGTLAGASA